MEGESSFLDTNVGAIPLPLSPPIDFSWSAVVPEAHITRFGCGIIPTMSDLEHHIKALHEIREKKREIQDLESELRLKIIDLTGDDVEISLPDVSLNVSSKVRFKVVDSESVPSFLKSNLPDPKRIEDYYNETGNLPKGVELSKTYYVKVKGSRDNESPQVENESSHDETANKLRGQSSDIHGSTRDEQIDLTNFPDRHGENTLVDRDIQCKSALACMCCEKATSVVEVLEFDFSLDGQVPVYTHQFCGKCYASWIQSDHPELANEYRERTAERLGIVLEEESSIELLSANEPEEYIINHLDFTYFEGRCQNCDADSVVNITGEYETGESVDVTFCGKCAADTVRSTDSGLADYFQDLTPEEAQAEVDAAREFEERKRDMYEQEDRAIGRIRNDPDDPFSNFSDGSSPFSY